MAGALYATVARAQRAIDEQCFVYGQMLRQDDEVKRTPEEIAALVEERKKSMWAYEESKHLERCKMVFRFTMAATVQATAKHISIRPREEYTDWPAFREAITSFTQSSIFSAAVWSFEQKGETDNDLGKGFHAHVVVRLQPGRYNSHIIRALKQTGILGAMCGDAGCQIDTAKTPHQLIQGYLLDYVSPADEHKETTRESDAKWRTREGIMPIYGNLSAFGVEPPVPLEPSP